MSEINPWDVLGGVHIHRIDEDDDIPSDAVYAFLRDVSAQVRFQVLHGKWNNEFRRDLRRVLRDVEDFIDKEKA